MYRSCFDSPRHPKIVQLRTEHELDELTRHVKTDIERAAVLKKRVAGALKFGTPAPDVFSDWSAVALLARAKQGQVVWCGQAAMVFQQACLALGMPARFIELGIPQTPACHFTTEVFLREQGKWAVVDATPLPEFAVYYMVDGVPQSAKTIPWEKQKHSAWYLRNERLAAWNISDPALIDWKPTERVKIVLCPGEEKWIFVQLWNGDVEFDHYRVQIDSGDWEDLPKTNTRDWSGRRHGWGLERFSVEAKPGLHEVQVSVARHDGSTGPQSFVRFRVK